MVTSGGEREKHRARTPDRTPPLRNGFQTFHQKPQRFRREVEVDQGARIVPAEQEAKKDGVG